MAERLNKSLLYTYGIADLCFVLMISMELYFFPAFLTDYAQFPLSLAAQILWVTSIFDLLAAVAAGIILQKATLRFGGKYRSWFLVGPPIVAPLFILQFTKIGSDATAALLIVAGFMASHLLFNVVFAASGAMVGRLSELPDERTVLSASRAQGITASGLVFSAIGLPMIVFFGAYTNKVAGMSIAAGVFTVLMIAGYWYIYRMTAGKDPYDEAFSHHSDSRSGPSMGEIARLVFQNPPLLALNLAEIFRNAPIAIATGLAFYYFEYVAKNLALVSAFILAISVAGVAGACAAAWIGVKMGKRNAYWVFMALSAVAFLSARFAAESAWGFTALMCVACLFGAVPTSMSTALFADTVVYGEWKTGKNIRAFTMALFNVPIKLAVLVRSAVISLGLVAIGFVANATPTPDVIDGISSLMTLAPAAASALGAAIFYFGYRIEDQHVLRMQEEMATRPKESAAV
jgi:Na+/melibiose symporter-like transporter